MVAPAAPSLISFLFVPDTHPALGKLEKDILYLVHMLQLYLDRLVDTSKIIFDSKMYIDTSSW